MDSTKSRHPANGGFLIIKSQLTEQLMKLGIVYLLTGTQLAARLVVSIYSLRRFYDGPITLFTTRLESHEIGELCAADRNLRVNHLKTGERDGVGYKSSYLTKTAILDKSPYQITAFLDADTLVVNHLGELLDAAGHSTVTATAFCGWSTDKDPTRSAIQQWCELDNAEISGFSLTKLIEHVLARPYPSINAGVFAVRSRSAFSRTWDQLTMLGQNMGAPEEIALQLLLPHFPHTLLGLHYNCHPYLEIDPSCVRIWHFAGCTHLRHPRSAQLWLPAYQECIRNNIAKISVWSRVEQRLSVDDRCLS